MTNPPKPPHDGKLGLVDSSGVTSSGKPIRPPLGSFEALSLIKKELEGVMITSHYLEGAPFSWVTLAILYEEEDGGQTEFGRINKTYGDLPLTVQLDVGAFRGLDRRAVTGILRSVVIKALIDAGERYGRPTEAFKCLIRVAPTGKAKIT
ncbi:MAG: Imm39 family immunity protein [Pseudomonadota bacterium]